jgi:TolB protein
MPLAAGWITTAGRFATEAVMAFATLAALAALGASSAHGGAAPHTGLIAFERVVGANSDIYSIAPGSNSATRLTDWTRSDFAPSWSPSGRLAFVSDRSGSFQLFTMTASGRGQRLLTRVASPPNKNGPDWAPDGRRVAFSAGTPRRADIYVLTIGRSRPERLTRTPADDTGPAWSPDGAQLAFSSQRGISRRLYRYDLASRTMERLGRGPGSDLDPAWAPDGRRIAFTRRGTDGNYDIYVLDLTTGEERRLTRGRAEERDPTWSPDGTAIAFVTNRDAVGDYEIYLMRADGSGPTNVSRSPSTHELTPDWSSASVRPPPLRRSPALVVPASVTRACDPPIGTPDDDQLVGNPSDQVLCGKGGNDTIRGGGGADAIFGGPGHDSVWGDRGDDAIQGGDGKDKLHGGRGADAFYPGGGKDWIDGGGSKLDRCTYCDRTDKRMNVEL